MRTSLIISLALHGLILTIGLISFSAHNTQKAPQSVSVDLLTKAEFSAVKSGKPDDNAASEATKKSTPIKKDAEVMPSKAKPQVTRKVSRKEAALPPPKPKTDPPDPVETDTKQDAQPETINEPKTDRTAPVPTRRKRADTPKAAQNSAQKLARSELRKPDDEKPKPHKASRRKEDRIAELIDRPTQTAPGESDFDPRKISALLNRDPTAGERPSQDGPREPWRTPSTFQEQLDGLSDAKPERVAYGEPEGRDARMTANEIDAFRAQIVRCWSPPVGGLGGDAIVVKLSIRLNEDGSLKTHPDVMNNFPSPFFRPTADSALRAVIQCQPYNMPPDKYSQWQNILLTFDPSWLYGG